MLLTDRFRKAFAAFRGVAAVGGTVPWHLPEFAAARGAPAVTSSSALGLTAVHRACSLYADQVADRKPSILVLQDSGGLAPDRASAAGRALATLTYGDLEMWAFSTALLGNGYMRMYRDERGAPYAFETVPSWRVSLQVEQGTRRVWYQIAEDESLDERKVVLPESDVVHARYRSIGPNRLLGVPPIVSCRPALEMALHARDTQRRLFEHVAWPGIVLTTDKRVEADVAERMQTRWEQNFGREGLGRTAVLGNGMEATQLRYNAVDAQLTESLNLSIFEVARAFGIPSKYLEADDKEAYASSVEGTRALYTTSLRPFFARLADALGLKLLSREQRAKGTSVVFDATDLLVMPGTETAEFGSKLVNAGICTPNEVRNRYLGLEDIEGGDELRAPVNTAPLDRWIDGQIGATNTNAPTT